MNTKIFALFLVVLVIFASGCAAQTAKTEVKTPEQASKAAQDVGESVGDVSAAISDVDKALGGTE